MGNDRRRHSHSHTRCDVTLSSSLLRVMTQHSSIAIHVHVPEYWNSDWSKTDFITAHMRQVSLYAITEDELGAVYTYCNLSHHLYVTCRQVPALPLTEDELDAIWESTSAGRGERDIVNTGCVCVWAGLVCSE